jgi:hypothetical protein
VAAIRIWLRSAPRAERPHRPVSGKSAYFGFVPPETVSRAFYALPKHAGSRTKLNSQHLPEGTRIAGPPHRPGDASCQKCPQDASPNSDPHTQPVEKEELKTSRLKISHSGQDASPAWAVGPVWGSRFPDRLSPEIPKTAMPPPQYH